MISSVHLKLVSDLTKLILNNKKYNNLLLEVLELTVLKQSVMIVITFWYM